MRKLFKNNEDGQSLVEFSLILVMLIVLVCVPIELIRFINLRVTLCGAATESLTQVEYASVKNDNLHSDIANYINKTYGDRLDVGTVEVYARSFDKKKESYPYYVYTNELEQTKPDSYREQFERRNSNYECATVELELCAKYHPITFLGSMFIGDDVTVRTPSYQTIVYVDGYVPVDGGTNP